MAHGEPWRHTPKVFNRLALLVEHTSYLVSRDELLSALWWRGFVTHRNLAKPTWSLHAILPSRPRLSVSAANLDGGSGPVALASFATIGG